MPAIRDPRFKALGIAGAGNSGTVPENWFMFNSRISNADEWLNEGSVPDM